MFYHFSQCSTFVHLLLPGAVKRRHSERTSCQKKKKNDALALLNPGTNASSGEFCPTVVAVAPRQTTARRRSSDGAGVMAEVVGASAADVFGAVLTETTPSFPPQPDGVKCGSDPSEQFPASLTVLQPVAGLIGPL